jgi:hypothetical protein
MGMQHTSKSGLTSKLLLAFFSISYVCLILALLVSVSLSRETFDQSHSVYDSLLKKYVKNGRVDYSGFIASKEEFASYLNTLGSVEQSDYDGWTEEEKLAFWINAYNAFTIKAIIDNYPITRSFSIVGLFVPSNSILQIKGVWDKLKFKAVGNEVTLEDIEHEILRKQFDEPRIHMAINCASVSCPDLRNEAYVPGKLQEQLTQASVSFMNNPEKGLYIDEGDGIVKLSKIFNWFGDDFISIYGDGYSFKGRNEKENAALNFALVYVDSDSKKEYLKRNNFRIGYLNYDWHLNELEDY